MANLINAQGYITNPTFSGGVSVTPTGSSAFNAFNSNNPQFGFVSNGIYVGTQGDLVVKTVDSSVLTFVSASGLIPGLIAAVSSSSTATNIIALK
jgi:hypothetical protein